MKLCKLLLPPMNVGGKRYTEIGDRIELTDGDAEMFAGCGVVEILPDAEPATETPAKSEALDPAEEATEPLEAPAKSKPKR